MEGMRGQGGMGGVVLTADNDQLVFGHNLCISVHHMIQYSIHQSSTNQLIPRLVTNSWVSMQFAINSEMTNNLNTKYTIEL